jgi:hypothetical protein
MALTWKPGGCKFDRGFGLIEVLQCNRQKRLGWKTFGILSCNYYQSPPVRRDFDPGGCFLFYTFSYAKRLAICICVKREKDKIIGMENIWSRFRSFSLSVQLMLCLRTLRFSLYLSPSRAVQVAFKSGE